MDQEYLIRKWLSGEASESELEILKESGELDKLERIDRALNKFKAPDFNQDFQYPGSSSTDGRENQIWLPVFRAAAAILILVSAFAIFFINPSVIVETGTGQTVSFILPDSSSVQLNSQSRVSYLPDSWEHKRTVNLSGEAFFTVKKGSDFDVHTDHGTIRVVGTAFNIRAREAYFEVICVEGKVSVIQEDRSDLLVAGSRLKRLKSSTLIDRINREELLDSRSRYTESKFDDVPLKEIVNELERQFGIEIKTGSVDLDRLMTTTFTHEDLDIALQTVFMPVNVSYSVEGNIVILEGRAP